jgi:aspartyl-tRNA(Asn)/glutamyl-tRNA(Gln) amidotransferase subunit A
VFHAADAIVTASRTDTAPPLDQTRGRQTAKTMSDMLRAGANVAGLPGVAFPCGLADDGLPVGLHLIGPRGSDALLLSIASAYQRATPHHLLRPG